MLDFVLPADHTTMTCHCHAWHTERAARSGGLLTLETASENACLERQQTRQPRSRPYAWPYTPENKPARLSDIVATPFPCRCHVPEWPTLKGARLCEAVGGRPSKVGKGYRASRPFPRADLGGRAV